MLKEIVVNFLTEDDITKIHQYIIKVYGGADGVINENLIGSIVYSTQYYNNVLDIASSYFFKIIKDHIFRDGDKRTACASLALFLKLNNKKLTMTCDELYEITIKVAENKILESELKLELLSKII